MVHIFLFEFWGTYNLSCGPYFIENGPYLMNFGAVKNFKIVHISQEMYHNHLNFGAIYNPLAWSITENK